MNALAVILAYLLGSIPFGYLIVKWHRGGDVRATGSGATGATNVLRSAGRVAGVATLVLDALKGFAAVYLARWLTGTAGTGWVVAFAAVAAIAGHIFPVWLGFKAGKGVATGLGVFLAIAPVAVGCAALLFGGIVALTRFVSLGSIMAAISMPVWVFLFERKNPDLIPMLVALVLSAILIVGKHHANIARLFAGSEHKLGARKST
jgi:glycerol-3-phosphate acyltransferase PlsY